jgi:hypothetical protein
MFADVRWANFLPPQEIFSLTKLYFAASSGVGGNMDGRSNERSVSGTSEKVLNNFPDLSEATLVSML